jgi:hypothetical protein
MHVGAFQICWEFMALSVLCRIVISKEEDFCSCKTTTSV